MRLSGQNAAPGPARESAPTPARESGPGPDAVSLRVAGVDLAAEPTGTALAVLRVEALSTSGVTRVTLESLKLGVDDDTIVRATRDVQVIGIDCALGWPVDFVEFVSRHAAAAPSAAASATATATTPATTTTPATAPTPDLAPLQVTPTGDLAWRRRLAYRETDRVVAQLTGARPLSVATDRLGMTALRCAVLLDRLAGDGRVVDRSGEHPSAVVEVYPAMALRVWGLARPGYKATAEGRRALIADVERAAPWLVLGEHRALMLASGDALDAVLAALVAVTHVRGEGTRPTQAQAHRARVEGWIAIPTVDLAEWGGVPLTNGIS